MEDPDFCESNLHIVRNSKLGKYVEFYHDAKDESAGLPAINEALAQKVSDANFLDYTRTITLILVPRCQYIREIFFDSQQLTV